MTDENKPDYKGEKNGNSKLTYRQVIEIRHKYKLGYKQSCIAKDFDVSYGCINHIILRATWKHVDSEDHLHNN